MSLCGLIPIQKVCDLELCLKEMHIDQEYQQMEDGTTITTISEDRIEQINEQLLKIVDWQIESDFEELNSSYDDEESDLQMFSNPVDDLLQDGDLCNESGEDADETAVGDDSTKSIDRKHGPRKRHKRKNSKKKAVEERREKLRRGRTRTKSGDSFKRTNSAVSAVGVKSTTLIHIEDVTSIWESLEKDK